MTTAHDRASGRDRSALRPPWDGVSLLSDRAGTPWWTAVLVALALTATGVFLDLQRINRLGLIFQIGYFLGCLIAIAVVERRGLFGPMVQPPLILAVVVPGVVLLAGGAPPGGGVAAQALAIATPLINGFPTMAITTGVTLAIGAFRLATQREPASERTPRSRRDTTDQPPRGPGKQ